MAIVVCIRSGGGEHTLSSPTINEAIKISVCLETKGKVVGLVFRIRVLYDSDLGQSSTSTSISSSRSTTFR